MNYEALWKFGGLFVSFIVFVLILHRLLYRPVGKMLRERKEEMEAELHEANKLRAEAETARAEVEQREKELEDQRDGILKDARDQAEAHRKEVLKEAEDQARGRLERFRRIMKQERDDLLANITDELRATILQTTASIFGDDAARFADRGIECIEALLQEMSDQDAADAGGMLAEADGCAAVRSAGPLDDKQQDRLRKALAEKFGTKEIQIELEEDASLIAGIEVTLGHINLSAHWRGLVEEALQGRDASHENG